MELSVDILSKLKKIEALTHSSFQGEKEVATAIMLKLIAKYNLNNFDLEAANFKRELIYLNLRRLNFAIKRITYLLNRYFLVETIFIPVYRAKIDKEEKALEILGRTANVEIAKFIFTYLEKTSQKMWLTYKSENKKANKNSFMLGLFKGFEERLLNNNLKDENLNISGENAKNPKLIDFKAIWLLKEKDIKLNNYFSKVYPKVKKSRASINVYCQESIKIGYKLSENLNIKYPLKEFRTEIKLLGR